MRPLILLTVVSFLGTLSSAQAGDCSWRGYVVGQGFSYFHDGQSYVCMPKVAEGVTHHCVNRINGPRFDVSVQINGGDLNLTRIGGASLECKSAGSPGLIPAHFEGGSSAGIEKEI